MTPDELKKARAELGLTIKELAVKLCCTKSTVDKWISGKHPVKPLAAKEINRLIKKKR